MNTTLPKWRTTAPPGMTLAQAMSTYGGPMAQNRMVRGLEGVLSATALGRWRMSTVANMTPQQVEWTLRNGLYGDMQSQWELFDMMEDTWPRLAKDLSEIKRSVAAMKWDVVPWAEENEAPKRASIKRANLVSRMIWRMDPSIESDERNFQGIIYDLLDAWGKGLSLVEMIWHETPDGIAPRCGLWMHPVNYALSQENKIGLAADRGPMGYAFSREVTPFPEHKVIIGSAKGRTAHVSCAAMLRPLAWWWAASNFSATWLLNYAQIFGVPIRWAKYATGASDDTIAKIAEKLDGAGSAGWALFPEGTEMQILEGAKTAGSSPQEAVLDLADKYCDLLVLGQTLTSDAADRGTQALGTVHEGVRTDVMQSAADWVAGVLNQYLVRSIIELNYGDNEMLPELKASPMREKDHKALAERDVVLMPHIPMPKAWLYQRHEIPIPEEGEETIGGHGPAMQQPFSGLPWAPNGQGGQAGQPDKSDPSDDDSTEAARAQNAVQASSAADKAQRRISRIVWQAMAESVGARTRWLEPVAAELDRIVQAAANQKLGDEELVAFLEAAQRRLPELFGKMDREALASSLEDAMGAAAVAGVEDAVKSAGKR
jgi:phage gp29-like protein